MKADTGFREPCDRSLVTVVGPAIGFAIGFDAEDEPREWLDLDVREARQLARALKEAAALAEGRGRRARKRGDP